MDIRIKIRINNSMIGRAHMQELKLFLSWYNRQIVLLCETKSHYLHKIQPFPQRDTIITVPHMSPDVPPYYFPTNFSEHNFFFPLKLAVTGASISNYLLTRIYCFPLLSQLTL